MQEMVTVFLGKADLIYTPCCSKPVHIDMETRHSVMLNKGMVMECPHCGTMILIEPDNEDN